MMTDRVTLIGLDIAVLNRCWRSAQASGHKAWLLPVIILSSEYDNVPHVLTSLSAWAIRTEVKQRLGEELR